MIVVLAHWCDSSWVFGVFIDMDAAKNTIRLEQNKGKPINVFENTGPDDLLCQPENSVFEFSFYEVDLGVANPKFWNNKGVS